MSSFPEIPYSSMPGTSTLVPTNIPGMSTVMPGVSGSLVGSSMENLYSGMNDPASSSMLTDHEGYISKTLAVSARNRESGFDLYGKHDPVFLFIEPPHSREEGLTILSLSWLNSRLHQSFKEGLLHFDEFARDFVVNKHSWYFGNKLHDLGFKNEQKRNPRTGAARSSSSSSEDDFGEGKSRDNFQAKEPLGPDMRSKIREIFIRFLSLHLGPLDYFFNRDSKEDPVEPGWAFTRFVVQRDDLSIYDTAEASLRKDERDRGFLFSQDPDDRDAEEKEAQRNQDISNLQEDARRQAITSSSGRSYGGGGKQDVNQGSIHTKEELQLGVIDRGGTSGLMKLQKNYQEKISEMVEEVKSWILESARAPRQNLFTAKKSALSVGSLFSGFFNQNFRFLGVCDVLDRTDRKLKYGIPTLSDPIIKAVFQREIFVHNLWGKDIAEGTHLYFLLRRKQVFPSGTLVGNFISKSRTFGQFQKRPKESRSSLYDGFTDRSVSDKVQQDFLLKNRESYPSMATERYGSYELVPLRAPRSGVISLKNMGYVNMAGTKEYPQLIPVGTSKYECFAPSSYADVQIACGLHDNKTPSLEETKKAMGRLPIITLLLRLEI